MYFLPVGGILVGGLVAGAIWQYKKKHGAYAPRLGVKKLDTEKVTMNRLDSEAAASSIEEATMPKAIITAWASPIKETSL